MPSNSTIIGGIVVGRPIRDSRTTVDEKKPSTKELMDSDLEIGLRKASADRSMALAQFENKKWMQPKQSNYKSNYSMKPTEKKTVKKKIAEGVFIEVYADDYPYAEKSSLL